MPEKMPIITCTTSFEIEEMKNINSAMIRVHIAGLYID